MCFKKKTYNKHVEQKQSNLWLIIYIKYVAKTIVQMFTQKAVICCPTPDLAACCGRGFWCGFCSSRAHPVATAVELFGGFTFGIGSSNGENYVGGINMLKHVERSKDFICDAALMLFVLNPEVWRWFGDLACVGIFLKHLRSHACRLKSTCHFWAGLWFRRYLFEHIWTIKSEILEPTKPVISKWRLMCVYFEWFEQHPPVQW